MSVVSEHYTLGADEAEAVWFAGCLATLKGLGAQTGGVLAAVEFRHPPGFATPRHVHHDADEAFYVLAGSLRGFCGDRTWRATTGGFVWLPRGIPHGYAVDGDAILRTLALTVPAGFDQFVADASDPAETRTLPPPGELDIPRLVAAGKKHNIEILGPPDF